MAGGTAHERKESPDAACLSDGHKESQRPHRCRVRAPKVMKGCVCDFTFREPTMAWHFISQGVTKRPLVREVSTLARTLGPYEATAGLWPDRCETARSCRPTLLNLTPEGLECPPDMCVCVSVAGPVGVNGRVGASNFFCER